MSSLKMTFSLTSLILLMALIAVPVMAQEDLAVTLATVTSGPTTAAALDGDAADRFDVIKKVASTAITGIVEDVDATEIAALPDLEERFVTGTTIALLAPAATQMDGATAITSAANAVQAKSVVISEIMWGLNKNAATFANRSSQQWIEFYNTTVANSTKGSVDTTTTQAVMGAWILYFVDEDDDIPVPAEATVGTVEKVKNVVELELVDSGADPEPAEQYILVDMVSNLAGGGWTVVTETGTYGQSGKLKQTTADTTASVEIVSMYRKINYDNVTKDHEQDTAEKNRGKQLEAIPGGGGSGSWAKSTRAYDNNLIGTPGTRSFRGAVTIVTASPVTRTKVILSEIGNLATDAHDWVEIQNVSGDAYNLKNHHLSFVKKADAPPAKAADGETSLVNFKDVDAWIPAGGVLLVLASDPDNDGHPIAGGINIKDKGIKWDGTSKMYMIEDGTDRIPNGAKSLYYIDAANGNGFVLPDDDTLIILRSAHDKLGTDSNLLDVNGGLSIKDRSPDKATDLWPLKKTGAAHKMFIEGMDDNRKFTEGAVYFRKTPGGGTGEKHWGKAGYTGIGYKRKFSSGDESSGTPGYKNDAVKVYDKMSTHADYMMPPVTISEIMFDTAGNKLPQWIELYNSSMTQGVQLDDWQLKLESMDDVPMRRMVTVKLASKIIPPNQTVLIVAAEGRRSDGRFPDSRVIELWTNGLKDKNKLEIHEGTSRRAFKFLSETAFKVTLMDKAGVEVDVAGNYGADPAWDLVKAENNIRSSIIRRYNTGAATGMSAERGSGEAMAQDGTMPIWSGEGTLGDAGGKGNAGWVLASEADIIEKIYYGRSDDEGTPGLREGGPLPVSLSKFRPERLKDTGEIVVRWITESELNNAGFNILRSEERDKDFTKVHYVAGQGTTSERTVYEWKDKSAKPNVVYYYQIQDVSLDGKVTTLRTTHLRGNVTAAGKLTTTWAGLKALQ